MGIKKSIENLGKQLVGKGEQVRFSNAVEEYKNKNAVSDEEAQKAIFAERLRAVSEELRLTGTMSLDSRELKSLTGSIAEVFSPAEIEKMKLDSLLPTFSIPSVMVDPKDFSNVRKQYEKKFDGKTPCTAELRNTAEDIKEMGELLSRFSTTPNLTSTASLQDFIMAHPEDAADIGRILILKERMESRDGQFEKEHQFDKEIQSLKERTKEIFGMSTLHEVTHFFGEMFKGVGDVSKGRFGPAVLHTSTALARLTTKGLLGATKLGLSGAKAAHSYVKKSLS